MYIYINKENKLVSRTRKSNERVTDISIIILSGDMTRLIDLFDPNRSSDGLLRCLRVIHTIDK